jgi:alpha-tubulin suppressor-like RCC1 family protein
MNPRTYIIIVVIVGALIRPCFGAKRLQAVAISGGEDHTAIISDNNQVFVAGNNSFSQLGLGDTTPRYALTRMKTATGFIEHATVVAAGWKHSLFLTKTGRVPV